MAEYSSDPAERSSLLLLSATAGTPVLKGWRMEKAPTLLDILATFPNTNPPLDRLIQVLARLQPRYYSIASLSSSPSIVFNVSAFTDGFGRAMKGLATGWMDSLTGSVTDKDEWHDVSGDVCLPIFKKQSGYFAMPMESEKKRDLMLVATGTGIAPFIPFLEALEKDGFKGMSVWLVYGARFLNDDFLFMEYLTRLAEKYPRDGSGFRLDLCVSRGEEKSDAKGVNVFQGYVHDFCGKESVDVKGVVEKGSVFVCGSMRMNKSLDKCLVGVIEDGGGDGSAVLKGMREEKRYIREIWG
jgi:sulfite reductase alpha subunit-like flavoprotein